MSRAAPDTRLHFCAEIRPNQSLSLASMVGFFLSLVFVVTVIGIYLSLRGAWMVLPFAGLELAIVAAVLIAVSRHAQDYELVLIDQKRVCLTRRCGAKETRHEFHRYWTRVFVEPGLRRWHPSRLFIGSHGRRVALGASMTESARRKLATQLEGAIRSA